MKKKRLIILLSFLIPIFILTGLALWIVTTDHVITPAYDENHTLAQYFVEETNTSYDGNEKTPNFKDGVYTNDEDKENFLNTVDFYYKTKGTIGAYTEGLPTNAGTYSVKILEILDSNDNSDNQEGALYVTINISTVNPTLATAVSVSYAKQTDGTTRSNYFVTSQKSSDITYTGSFKGVDGKVLEGTIAFSGTELQVGINNYEYTFTPTNTNYNTYTNSCEITTYATVTYKDYNSSVIKVDEVVYGTVLTEPSHSNRPGHTFRGWNNGATQWDFSNSVTDDLVLIESWNVDRYTITYNLDGGTENGINPISYTVDDTFTLINPSKENLTFAGWIETNNPTPSTTVTINKGTTGNLTFTATWKCLVVFLDLDGETKLHEVLVDCGSRVETPSLGTVTSDYQYTRKLVWQNKDTGSIYSLVENKYLDAEIKTNLNIKKYVQEDLRKYTINVYYKDKDNEISSIKTNTSSDLTYNVQAYNFLENVGVSSYTEIAYGSSFSLKRQIRLATTYTYYSYDSNSGTNTAATRYINCFYMSTIDTLDWSMVQKDMYAGDNIFVTTDVNKSEITILLLCVQPQAIVTDGKKVSDAHSLDAKTSDYGVWYEKMNDAFEACKNTTSTKHLRIYGQSQYKDLILNGHCLETDKTIPGYSVTINSITYTIPTYTKLFSDYELTTYTDEANKKFTINSNLSVILPYGTEDATTDGYKRQIISTEMSKISSTYMHSVLTIPKGVTVDIEGKLVVGGAIGECGAQFGFGTLMNKGTINIKSGKELVSYGYLKGTNDAVIHALSGSTISDVFRIYDWPGGRNALGIYGGTSGGSGIFPINSYSSHNISCKTIIYSGSSYKCWNQLYMSSSWTTATNVTLLGAGGLFQLNDGYIVKTVEETTEATNLNTLYSSSNQLSSQREIYNVFGSFTDNKISMDVKILLSVTIETGHNLPLPIGMMKIIQNTGKAIFSENSYKFLPGSHFEVKKEASVEIKDGVKISIIDDFDETYVYTQGSATSSGATNPYSYHNKHLSWYNTYKGTENFGAKFIIDGTMNSNGNIGGIILTTGENASIYFKNTSSSYNYLTALTYNGSSLALSGSEISKSSKTLNVQLHLYNGTEVSSSTTDISTSGTYYSIKDSNSKYGWFNADNKATLNYNLDGGIGNCPSSKQLVLYGDSYTLTEDDINYTLSKAHYVFKGWRNSSGDMLSSGDILDRDDLNIYAYFEPITYNIEYVHQFEGTPLENVNNSNPNTFNHSINQVFNNPSVSDYKFAGWYLDSSFNTSVSNLTGSNLVNYLVDTNSDGVGDTVYVYSKWTIDYVLTFNYNSPHSNYNSNNYFVTLSENEVSTFNTYNSIENEDKTSEQYYFVGWNTQADGNGDTIYAYSYDAATNTYSGTVNSYLSINMFNEQKEMTLYGMWASKSKLEFVTNSSDAINPKYYITGSSINVETLSDNDEYKFDGWYDNAEFAGTPITTIALTIDKTLYAKWTPQPYIVTIENEGTTIKVTVDGKPVYSGGEIPYGSTVSVEHSSSYNESKNYKVTVYNNSTSSDIVVKNSAGTFTFTMPASNIKISGYSEDNSCIVSGTLITLADGSKKPVDEITYDDDILVFNHETGKWDVSRMLFITHEDEGFKEYETITLHFSNNYSITIVAEHGFYDMDLMRYVFINKDNIDSFIGHKFYSAELINNELNIEYLELLSYEINTEYTKIYCPVTAYHMNSFNNGLLAMPNFPYGAEGLVNIFEYDDDLKFNEEKMKADIEKYGIFEYEYFKDYFSYEAYLASPAVYLKVSIGKGYLTHEQMMLVIEYLLTGDLIE